MESNETPEKEIKLTLLLLSMLLTFALGAEDCFNWVSERLQVIPKCKIASSALISQAL